MKKIQSNKRALSKLVIGICAALGAQQTVAGSLTKVRQLNLPPLKVLPPGMAS